MIALFNLDHLLKVIDPEPVLIDHQACLVARHRRSACRACIDVCPEGAVKKVDGKIAVDTGLCTRCGLCAGACPTAAMTVRGIDDGLAATSPAVHCALADGLGVALPCLGYMTADHMLAAAIRHGSLELTRGECDSCHNRQGGRMADRAVAMANRTLSALGSNARIRMTTRPVGAASARAISRRDLFSLWRTESVQMARQFVAEEEVNHARLPARLPARRKRWLRLVDPQSLPPESTMPEGPWKARTVSDACTGCGICVAFCPTGAFAKRDETQTWVLSHQPAACLACNTCVDLCPVRAVSEEPLATADMVAGSVRGAARLTMHRCATCRREFKGRPEDTQCPHCRSVSHMFNR